MPSSIDVTFTPERPNTPFEAAHHALIAELAAVRIPAAISVMPRPGEFEAVGDYLRDVVAVADKWLAKLGAEVCANTTVPGAQLDMFDGAFFGAVDGFGLWAIERAADEVSDELRSSGGRYCRSRRGFYQALPPRSAS